MNGRRTCMLLLAGLLIPVSDRMTVAASIEDRIEALLNEALSARTMDQSVAKIQEAGQLLEPANRRLTDLDRAYFKAEIKRTRGRVALLAWQREPVRGDLRVEAKRLLIEARNDYEQFIRRCRKEQEEIEQDPKIRNPSKSPLWNRAQHDIIRSNYALAWTDYWLGKTLADESQRERRLASALRRFVLNFTARNYQKNNAILAQCFLGHALCLYELKRYPEVIEILKDAKHTNTRHDIYQQMTSLRIRTYQAMGSHGDAERLGSEYLRGRPAARRDKSDWPIAIACLESLSVLADPKTGPDRHDKCQERLETLAEEVYHAGEPWRSELTQALAQSTCKSAPGYLSRARARFMSERFEAALNEAVQGLAVIDREHSQEDGDLLADLRYVRAAATWNLKRWADAHRAAFDFAKHHPDDDRTEEMSQCAFQAGFRAIEAAPPIEWNTFLQFVEFVETELRSEADVRKAPWQVSSRLLEAGKYAEAEQLLQKVRPTSPVYCHAQYGLALAAHRQFDQLDSMEPRIANKEMELLTTVHESVRRFVDVVPDKPSDEERSLIQGVVELATITARRLLMLDQPKVDVVLHLLDFIAKIPDAADLAAGQRLTLRIEANLMTGNVKRASELIQKISEGNTAKNIDAVLVLGYLGQSLEKRRERLQESNKAKQATQLAGQLVGVYGPLLRLVRRSRDPEVNGREAAVRHKLATALQQVDQHSQAIPHYEWLRGKLPAEKAEDVLHGLAIAYGETAQYEAAIEIWRALARKLEPRTEGWYEAKYHLIRCYQEAGNHDHAQKLCDFFLLQNPDIKAGQWDRRFRALGRTTSRPRS